MLNNITKFTGINIFLSQGLSLLKNALLDTYKLNYILSIVLGFTISYNAQSQDLHSYLREGNKSYKNNIFISAEENYRKALIENPNSYKANFNLGNALYQETRYDEVEAYYTAAASLTRDKVEKGDAYFNLGNAMFLSQELEKAIDAYKNALRNNPSDLAAKENLFYAQNMRQEEKKEEEQQEEGEDGEEQEDGEKKEGDPKEGDEKEGEEQEGEEGEDPSEEEQEPQGGEEDEKEGEEEEKEAPNKKGKLSKEDVDRLLQIQEAEEKNIQGKLQKGHGVKPESGKDW